MTVQQREMNRSKDREYSKQKYQNLKSIPDMTKASGANALRKEWKEKSLKYK